MPRGEPGRRAWVGPPGDPDLSRSVAVLICAALLVPALGGCAPGLFARVEAVASGSPSTGPFSIAPAPGRGGDPAFATFAAQAERALNLAGLGAAAAGPGAVRVVLDYGVSPAGRETVLRREQRTHDVWEERPVTDSAGEVVGSTLVRRQVETTTPRAETRDVFERRVELTAYSAAATAGPPLWRTVVTSNGPDPDLARLMPALLAAAVPHLGRSSAGVLEVEAPLTGAATTFIATGRR